MEFKEFVPPPLLVARLAHYNAIKANPRSPGCQAIMDAMEAYKAELSKASASDKIVSTQGYAQAVKDTNQDILRKTTIEKELKEAEERHKASLRTS